MDLALNMADDISIKNRWGLICAIICMRKFGSTQSFARSYNVT